MHSLTFVFICDVCDTLLKARIKEINIEHHASYSGFV